MNADAELDKYDDYETENERDEPSSTKKAKKIYLHKYKSEWENGEYKKWIKRSNKGIHYFHCKICTSDYIGGLAAVKKHAASMKHTKNAKAVNIQMSVTNMPFIKSNNVLNTQIKRAELKIAAFITEHNIAFNSAEHLVKLIKNISSEPEVVKNIQCNRTKCTSIVKNVIGQTVFEETIAKLKIYKFSIIVDESTDHSCIKNLAMVARFLENFKINDTFLTLLPIVDGSALALHSTIVNFFDKFEIPYKKNMIGFGADGANVMMGENHSLKTMLTNDVPGLFVLKCTCHSLALCASYACLKLPRGPEDFVRDIHSYMKYSFKRTSEFREFQQFVDAKPHKLLLPAQTR